MCYSMRDIEFGDAVLVTDKKPWFLPKSIRYSHTSKLDSIDKFNYKMVYELKDHINTDFCLVVHADGFVIHPELWRDEFLDYDYIGSPFPMPTNDYAYRDRKGEISRVGNSVSIRSRRLLEYPSAHNLKWEMIITTRIFSCAALPRTRWRSMALSGRLLKWPFCLAESI